MFDLAGRVAIVTGGNGGIGLGMIRTRLQRLKERETRKLFGVILGGKMLGLVAVFGLMKLGLFLLDSPAHALPMADPVVHQANDLVNPVNTIWVLVTAFLVFFMRRTLGG